MSGARRGITVRVRREDVSYPIVICPGAGKAELAATFAKLGLLEKRHGRGGAIRRRACVIIDEGFSRARPDMIRAVRTFLPPRENLYVPVPGVESSKSLSRAEKILGAMIKQGFNRNDLCVAIGGGVVGDLGGFVASVYHRGIDVVHVPTTLLSMVDSSIGGKTAVNHPEGKNLIGSFHQPVAVIAVLELLESLPDFDFLSGLGEVFKYAVGFSADLFRYLERHASEVLARKPAALSHVLLESMAIKAAVVGRDERETGMAEPSKIGHSRFADRRLLNLGHTIGHGIEKAYDMPHGMAVAVGTTMAAKLSTKLNLCPLRCYDLTMDLATKLALMTDADLDWRLADIMPYVRKDKKAVGDLLQFVCLKEIGHAFVCPVSIKDLGWLLE